jgi:hypothetical protein
MTSDIIVPRCRHGKIILGCPHDDCPEQNAYLAAQNATLDAWYARQQADARRLVRSVLGLPDEVRHDQ